MSLIPTGNIPFGAFREQLDSLVEATANKLEREFPQHLQSNADPGGLLRCLVLVSNNAYRTIRYFCADSPDDPSRRLEYALSATPLARSILEALFTTVFLFENLTTRASWFQRAGWREYKEMHQRLLQEYGNDPDWREYTDNIAHFIEESKVWWNITPQEQANARLIDYWPIPSQMAKHAQTSQARRHYLKYLEDWFYRDLSQDAHLSWPGLVRRVGYLLVSRPTDDDRQRLIRQKSDALLDAAIMLLAMLSEISVELQFGLEQRLRYVWSILRTVGPAVEDLYRQRYEFLLG